MICKTAIGTVEYKVVRDNAGDRLIVAGKEAGHLTRHKTGANGFRWKLDNSPERFHSVADIVRSIVE